MVVRRVSQLLGAGSLAAGIVFVALGTGTAQAATPVCTGVSCTVSFAATGAVQTFLVPAGVTSGAGTADGASGGAYQTTAAAGGVTTATVPVSPGDTLNLVIGEPGISPDGTSSA